MPRFTVYEVQEVTETRRYQYTVEAETAEEAIEAVKCADFSVGDMEEVGVMGETDYGDTGHCAFPADQPEPDDAWEKALAELIA